MINYAIPKKVTSKKKLNTAASFTLHAARYKLKAKYRAELSKKKKY